MTAYTAELIDGVLLALAFLLRAWGWSIITLTGFYMLAVLIQYLRGDR